MSVNFKGLTADQADKQRNEYRRRRTSKPGQVLRPIDRYRFPSGRGNVVGFWVGIVDPSKSIDIPILTVPDPYF